MRALSAPVSALLTALAFAALLPATPRSAEAGTGVIRCERPDGTRVYTNEGCGHFGASSVPISADLANRIVSERRAEVRATALQSGMDPAQPLAAFEAKSTLTAPAVTGPSPPISGCARTPRQLAQDLQASVAIGDVNRIAESFDWAGMQSRQADRVMDQLAALADRSIVGAEYFDVSIGTSTDALDAAGLMQITFRGGGGMVIDDFEVRRDSGCYFLRYA